MRDLFERSYVARASIWGVAILVPFVALELVNRRQFAETFPFAIFTFAWVLQTFFVYLLLLRPSNTMSAGLRIVGLFLIAYVWGGWVKDQWPCLMGVPNCD